MPRKMLYDKYGKTTKKERKYMPNTEQDKTITFSLGNDRSREIRQILTTVYSALSEKGYNPLNQIVGYILSEDPTYITNHKNARSLIRKVDRDELLNVIVKYYLGI